MAIFPGSHEAPVHEHQIYYEKLDIKGRDHLWLANPLTVVYFENGRATRISSMKG